MLMHYRLPAADSYPAIDMGEPEATPVMHAVISVPKSARTGWEIRLYNFGDNLNTTTRSTQLLMEAMESELIRKLLKPPTTGHYFISATRSRSEENFAVT